VHRARAIELSANLLWARRSMHQRRLEECFGHPFRLAALCSLPCAGAGSAGQVGGSPYGGHGPGGGPTGTGPTHVWVILTRRNHSARQSPSLRGGRGLGGGGVGRSVGRSGRNHVALSRSQPYPQTPSRGRTCPLPLQERCQPSPCPPGQSPRNSATYTTTVPQSFHHFTNSSVSRSTRSSPPTRGHLPPAGGVRAQWRCWTGAKNRLWRGRLHAPNLVFHRYLNHEPYQTRQRQSSIATHRQWTRHSGRTKMWLLRHQTLPDSYAYRPRFPAHPAPYAINRRHVLFPCGVRARLVPNHQLVFDRGAYTPRGQTPLNDGSPTDLHSRWPR